MLGGLISWLVGARSAVAEAGGGGFDVNTLLGRTATVREERTEVADELQAIEGVGPQIAELFHDNGVHRFHQIAEMSPADIRGLLTAGGERFRIAEPFTWPFQARLLAGGLIAEHFGLRERLTAGRLPLTGIKGLGPATATRLEAAGIATLDDLADAKSSEVTNRLNASGDQVIEPVVSGWIEHARGVRVGDLTHLATFFGVPAAVLSGRPARTYTDQREVAGALVDIPGLARDFGSSATAVATARPSLLPVWIGLGGALLTGLLSAFNPLKLPVLQPLLPAGGSSAISTELGTDTTFQTNSAVLTDAGKAAIDAQVVNPARKLDVASVRVVGHADVRGDDAFNLTLSRERADSVANYLRQKVRDENIGWNPRVIEVYGAGEQFPNPRADTATNCAPLAPTTPEASACYAPDRRVDVTIIAKGGRAELEAAAAESKDAP